MFDLITRAAVLVAGLGFVERQNSERIFTLLTLILCIGQFCPEIERRVQRKRKGRDLFLLLVPPPQRTEHSVQDPHSPTSQSTEKGPIYKVLESNQPIPGGQGRVLQEFVSLRGKILRR